jgi:hypothetical protein
MAVAEWSNREISQEQQWDPIATKVKGSSIASPFEEGLNMMFSQVDPRRSVATPVVLCSNAAS